MPLLPTTLRQRAIGGVLALPLLVVPLLVVPLLVLPLLVLPVPHAFAQTAEDEAEDQEVARQALENKEILPLSAVLAKVEGKVTGDIVEIELERKKGQWIYEIEVIGEDGRVRDVDVDAKTGEVINVALDE